jgi:threonine dehydratase
MGAPVWLKLESLQVTGSFKIRGAFFALAAERESFARTGVATCSAGNHGKAVAHAARELGVAATVYLPRNVDEAKHRAIVALGARAILSAFDGYDDTEAWAIEEAAREGLPFLSAFDDERIMAGNGGTLAAEMLERLPDLGAVVCPVGGGGLAAGAAYYLKEKRPDARFIGVQLAASPGLRLSLDRGEAVTRLLPAETIAGALEGGLGRKPFAVLRDRVDEVILIKESELREAFRWMLDRHQYLIEPASAVAVAAVLTNKLAPTRRPTALVISGRNVSLETIRMLL